MKAQINYIKTILLIVISMFSFTTIAQTNMTKIQDASVSSPNSTPHQGAVLELESNNKGLLIPRMTTGQRDAIPQEKRTESLLIYNTTTGCFNFWNTSQNYWLSICGTPPPAVFHITNTQCEAIIANGTYKQGDILTGSNYLSIPVTVTQPGTYNIIANTSNGYYFTANGTFPNAGTYTINLQGTGTPNTGYDPAPEVGDVVSISLNGITNSCEPIIFVEKASVSFELDCLNVSQEGDYFIGIATNSSNKLILTVDVTSAGYWNIYTNTVNGVSFAATGNFVNTGGQQIELLATGTPLASGTNNYTIYSNSEPTSSCSGITVVTTSVAYTMDCSNSVVNGNYMEGVATNSSNSISLSINVTATGNTTISTNTVNGISFTSGPITLSSLGNQTINLTASGTPTSGTNTELTITGGSATCNINIPVSPQPIAYTMTCGSITLSGDYAPGVAMTASNTMTINVNATSGGTWNITTNTLNGVSFSGSGTLTTGANTLTITASGTPLTGGSFNYTLTSNSTSGSTTCTKSVLFIYKTINILGLGGGMYQPGTASTSQASRAIIQSSANFGTTGTFPVNGFSIINGGTSQANTLKNHINNSNIDIIIIGYNYLPNAASRAILEDFVKIKKGVVIHSQENDASGTKDLIDKITGGTVTVAGTGTTYFNPTLNVDDPILNGPFGDIRNLGTGSDVNNSYYVTNLPSNVIILGTQNNNAARVHIFRHNTLGYIYIGDSGWTAGVPNNTSTTTWPAAITALGVPLSKSYIGPTTVYNSMAYANTLAWAIKYVQENIDADYQLP